MRVMNFETYKKLKLNHQIEFNELLEFFNDYLTQIDKPTYTAEYLLLIIKNEMLLKVNRGIGISDAISIMISYYESQNDNIHFLYDTQNVLIDVWYPNQKTNEN